MRKRFPKAELLREELRAFAVSALILLVGQSAKADTFDQLHGQFTASGLIGGGDYGGQVLVDGWAGLSIARLGLAAGVLGLSSDNDEHTRMVMPMGISLGVELGRGSWREILIVRGGAWTGATNGALGAGAWVSLGARIGLHISETALLQLGADATMLTHDGMWWGVAPGVGFAWNP